METQLASAALWLPTFCQFSPTTLPYQETTPISKQIIHPAILPSGQHVIVPQTASSPLLVQATQQIVPFLPHDAQHVFPCSDFLAQKLLFHPVQYLPSPSSSAVFEPGCQQHVSKLPQVQASLNADSIVPVLHKTQRRKKVSPSAKRRSRLRLIAFLEAKKEKCKALTTNESDSADGRISDSEEASIPSVETCDERLSPACGEKHENFSPHLVTNNPILTSGE